MRRQGSQFTSFDWTDRLKRAKTKISMDGKARYLDNIFIERLWRSLKYECVYLQAWEAGSQARAGVGRWITFYNHLRPHAAHGGQPPAVVYFKQIEPDQQVQVTLPPTFIQRERDSGLEFCPFGRVGQRGLARSFAGCVASGPVAGRRSVRTRRAFASQGGNGGARCCSPCVRRPA